MGPHSAPNNGRPTWLPRGCPIARLGGRPKWGVHSASTWPHVLRPPPTIWPTRLGHHLRPAGRPRSASTWLHVRPPSPSIVAPRLGPPPSTMAGPVRPTLAVRGFHFPAPSTSCALGDQFRPRFGSPLGDHLAAWPSTLQGRLGRPHGASPLHRPPNTIPPDASGHKNRLYPAFRARDVWTRDLHPRVSPLSAHVYGQQRKTPTP